MGQSYPEFQSSYTQEELIELFLLTPAEVALVLSCRGDANRCGMALLLKALPFLGYVQNGIAQIPPAVRGVYRGAVGAIVGSVRAIRLGRAHTRPTPLSHPAAHRMASAHGAGQGESGAMAAGIRCL